MNMSYSYVLFVKRAGVVFQSVGGFMFVINKRGVLIFATDFHHRNPCHDLVRIQLTSNIYESNINVRHKYSYLPFPFCGQRM